MHCAIFFVYDECWQHPSWWRLPLQHSNVAQPLNFLHEDGFMFVRDRIRPVMVWLTPSFSSKDTGGGFQSPNVPLTSDSNLSSTESSFSLLEAFRWEQFSLIMAARSAFSYLESKISTMHLVALRVLIGSWAKQVFSLSALVILGLSCRLAMFLLGRRILSIFVVFFWKSNTTPRS